MTRAAGTRVRGMAVQPDGSVRVERADRTVGAVGAAIGGVLFLGMAAFLAWQVLGGAAPPFMLIGPLGFGFFGVFMAAGALSTLRSRGERVALEIGPWGIWMPETGRLPWSEIAEVRLDRRPLFSATSTPGTPQPSYHASSRLGIVPLDPGVAAHAARSLDRRMLRAFLSWVHLLGAPVADPASLAPFAIAAEEVTVPLGEIADRIDAWFPVRREPVGGYAAQGRAAPVGAPPALDARLGQADPVARTAPRGIASVLPGIVSGSTAPAAAAVPAAPPRQIEFHRAPGRGRLVTGQVVSDFAWSGMSLVFSVVFWFVFLSVGMEPGLFLVTVPFLLIPVAFFLVGLPGVLAAPRRLASVRGDTRRLAVGPDGIWLPELGLLPWVAVEEVRIEEFSIVTRKGSMDSGRRLRLGVVPTDGRLAERRGWAIRAHDAWLATVRRIPGFRGRPAPAPFTVDLQLLGASVEEVAEAVRVHHPVTWKDG